MFQSSYPTTPIPNQLWSSLMIKAAPHFLPRSASLKAALVLFCYVFCISMHLSPSSCSYPCHKKTNPRLNWSHFSPRETIISLLLFTCTQFCCHCIDHTFWNPELRVETIQINVAQNLFLRSVEHSEMGCRREIKKKKNPRSKYECKTTGTQKMGTMTISGFWNDVLRWT